MKKTAIVLSICVLILAILNYKNIMYTDYQQDFIYLYDKTISNFPFLTAKEEDEFRKNKNVYLEKIKSVENEEEFVIKVNECLYSLNSIHTRLNNRADSYAIYRAYRDASNENPEYKKAFEDILNKFEEKMLCPDMSQSKTVKNKLNHYIQ